MPGTRHITDDRSGLADILVSRSVSNTQADRLRNRLSHNVQS